MGELKKFLVATLIMVVAYTMLEWAAANPESIQQLHQQVNATLYSLVDKCQRALVELSK